MAPELSAVKQIIFMLAKRNKQMQSVMITNEKLMGLGFVMIKDTQLQYNLLKNVNKSIYLQVFVDF